ncbi:MAG: alpha/beta hydrolase [Cyanobacteria bacterium Co-bin8]|nr:alpha/beta hydrolase [Cyanobacteria bacterium Co-bin8]
MPSITLRGVPHSYSLTAPEGFSSTLVFIHGWLLSQQYWSPVIDQLKPCCQCLSYDLRGFGNSCQFLDQYQMGMLPLAQRLGASYSPFSLAAYARDLGELLAQLELKPVWLVGHSLGASVALWAAYCYPEWIKGVICVNAGGGIYLRREFERFRAAGQQIVRFRPRWFQHFPGADLAFTRMMVARPLQRQWGRQRLLDLLQAHPEAALGSLLESTTEEEVHLLPRIVSGLSQPVYFLAGEQDRVMELKFVRYLASFHSLFEADDGNVFELANCGHMAMVEYPALVAETIAAVLKQHS